MENEIGGRKMRLPILTEHRQNLIFLPVSAKNLPFPSFFDKNLADRGHFSKKCLWNIFQLRNLPKSSGSVSARRETTVRQEK